MTKPSKNVSDLLAAIKRQSPESSVASIPTAELVKQDSAKEEPARKKTTAQSVERKVPKSKVGKPVQFWMHDEDRKLVRELSAWLAGQGVRPSDSMVIRAALRFAKTGNEFLECYWEASRLDGRLKRY